MTNIEPATMNDVDAAVELESRLFAGAVHRAREQGCVEAQVNHYAANTGAGSLYESRGFRPHSLNRVLLLE